MYARARLVEGIDSFVRHEAVCHVAVCQFDTCHQCFVRIAHVVMLLVAILNVTQYLQRLLVVRRLHLHLLESALQGSVFLDRVAVFVERCCTYTLYGAPCQCRFHDVGSIHRTWCRASSDNGVNLVDKYDHVGVGLQLLHQGFQALLELSAILRTGYYARHVEGVDVLAKEHRTCVVLGYQLCQSFHDGTLAHTRLTN